MGPAALRIKRAEYSRRWQLANPEKFQAAIKRSTEKRAAARLAKKQIHALQFAEDRLQRAAHRALFRAYDHALRLILPVIAGIRFAVAIVIVDEIIPACDALDFAGLVDHPTPLHMSEVDLPERLKRYGGNFYIRRIAVSTTEVASLSPFSAHDNPKNPNYRWYLKHYGDQCAELDAIDPPTLRARVREAVLAHIDPVAWARGLDIEAEELARIEAVHDRIVAILNGG